MNRHRSSASYVSGTLNYKRSVRSIQEAQPKVPRKQEPDRQDRSEHLLSRCLAVFVWKTKPTLGRTEGEGIRTHCWEDGSSVFSHCGRN